MLVLNQNFCNDLVDFLKNKAETVYRELSAITNITPPPCDVNASEEFNHHPKLLKFPSVSIERVLDLVKQTKSGAPSDLCLLKILQQLASVVPHISLHFLTLSSTQALFELNGRKPPSCLYIKTTMDSQDEKNYRPISCLPSPSNNSRKTHQYHSIQIS